MTTGKKQQTAEQWPIKFCLTAKKWCSTSSKSGGRILLTWCGQRTFRQAGMWTTDQLWSLFLARMRDKMIKVDLGGFPSCRCSLCPPPPLLCHTRSIPPPPPLLCHTRSIPPPPPCAHTHTHTHTRARTHAHRHICDCSIKINIFLVWKRNSFWIVNSLLSGSFLSNSLLFQHRQR